MSKPFEWKFDARELMTEKYMIPKGGKIFRYRQPAVIAMEKAQAQAVDEILIMRIWTCPGGWVVMNQHYEVLGGQRGARRKAWHALITRT